MVKKMKLRRNSKVNFVWAYTMLGKKKKFTGDISESYNAKKKGQYPGQPTYDVSVAQKNSRKRLIYTNIPEKHIKKRLKY